MFYSFPPPVFGPGLRIYLIEPKAFEAPLTMAHIDSIGPIGKNIMEILKKVRPKIQVIIPPSSEEKASLRVVSRFG